MSSRVSSLVHHFWLLSVGQALSPTWGQGTKLLSVGLQMIKPLSVVELVKVMMDKNKGIVSQGKDLLFLQLFTDH